MDMIFEADVGTAPPSIPTTPVAGPPSDGDLTTGKPATVIGAYWFYMITIELLNLIASAGLSAAGGTLNQVATAVQTIASNLANAAQTAAIAAATSLASAAQTAAQNTVLGWFTGSNQSLAANGYQKLPGGKIFQKVQVSLPGTANANATITYPIAFTTYSDIPVPTVVDASLTAGNSSNFLGLGIVSYSLTGCVVSLGQNGGGVRDVTLGIDVTGK